MSRSNPSRNFLDIDPTFMLNHYWKHGMRSLRPRVEFFRDPKLRLFGRLLQCLCIECGEPGSVHWTDCEPLPSYHALIGSERDDREALKEMYHRTLGVFRSRAEMLARRDARYERGGDAHQGLVLENILWNAGDRFQDAMHDPYVVKASHIVSFLKSCAYDLRNRPLPPLPRSSVKVFLNLSHAYALKRIFGDTETGRTHAQPLPWQGGSRAGRAPSTSEEPLFDGAERMDDTDDDDQTHQRVDDVRVKEESSDIEPPAWP